MPSWEEWHFLWKQWLDKLPLQDRTPTSKKNDHHEVVKLKIWQSDISYTIIYSNNSLKLHNGYSKLLVNLYTDPYNPFLIMSSFRYDLLIIIPLGCTIYNYTISFLYALEPYDSITLTLELSSAAPVVIKSDNILI